MLRSLSAGLLAACLLLTGCEKKRAPETSAPVEVTPKKDLGELYVVLHELFELAEEAGASDEAEMRRDMKPFVERAVSLAAELGVPREQQALIQAFARRIPTAPIYALEDEAAQLRDRIVTADALPVIPPEGATRAEAAKLYLRACSPCHGVEGEPDPAVAAKMHPPPPNLRWMARQPFLDRRWLYLVVTHGVPTTSMPSFRSSLSEDERWMLAHYVASWR